MTAEPRYLSNNINNRSTENGYNWYECSCCPYGYHIDLDFVRYCESISQEADRTGSIKRRKDRRRQRQSMEVLLGIVPPINNNIEPSYKAIQEQEPSPKVHAVSTDNRNYFFGPDGFADAVSDFEKTLQRSKNKLSHNLPDVTAVSDNIARVPSNSSISSTSGSSMTVLPTTAEGNTGKDFDTVSIESFGLSPSALQNIREQMALSLERTKQLEDQVKQLPDLREQLTALKVENQQLQYKLKYHEECDANQASLNYLSLKSRNRSQSFTNVDNLNGKEPPPPPPRKDFGVMCGVLTRNIGVGHQSPNTKNVSTATLSGSEEHSDKWFSEKIRFLNQQNVIDSITNKLSAKATTSMKATQTVAVSREQQHSFTQTYLVDSPRADAASQTSKPVKYFSEKAVTASPKTRELAIQKTTDLITIGVSEHTINDNICEKCTNLTTRTIATGPQTNEESHISPISLASLIVPRSRSFNLGDDKLNLNVRQRTVACQYELTGVNKASQYELTGISRSSQCNYEPKMYSKACQHELKQVEKTTQSQIASISRITDTKDLLKESRRHVACGTSMVTQDVGCNTTAAKQAKEKEQNKKERDEAREIEKTREKERQEKEREKEREVKREKEREVKREKEREDKRGKENVSPPPSKKEGGSPTPSRIPRPQVPTTPVEVRKFRRQDTYTKISPLPGEKSPPRSPGLSGLDLSSKPTSNESISSFENVKHSLKLSDISAQNGVGSVTTKVQIQESTLPMPETVLYTSTSHQYRKKAVPSKEMQGAMKVLNDSLQKHQSKNPKNQNAVDIIQQEWFKVSSLITANPLDVEDYLDAFEDMSSLLLEYVVNMTDASGNTAMHYAVSHGNFDVVSILLDSKVCDINKPNKAGYTSVMLISLVEHLSSAHANVVRRLFHLADVNIRAKQHGQTALMLSVSHGRLDTVKMLLEAGADVNIQDDDGSTALMCAAEHGHIEIVKLLLSQPDCDSTITDVDGSTALKIAMEAGHRPIGVLLYAHERNLHVHHGTKHKKSKPTSPKTPSSPLPIRSSHRALTKTAK